MNRIGIWLDKRQAHFIDPEKGIIRTVHSKIEEFHPKGGYGGESPYSQKDAMKDTQYEERLKHQIKDYCEEIIAHLDSLDRILIFGPAFMKTELKKAIGNSRKLESTIIDLQTADAMTENQMSKWVREYFDAETK